MRRRLYLMRHGAVAYFDDVGRPVAPDDVPLTDEGREQATAARELLADVRLDRVIASGLPRTAQTAALVAPDHEIETWPELKEITGAKLSSIPAADLEEAFVHAFRGVVPNDKQFLGGETIGALFDRVVPALERLVADDAWDIALVAPDHEIETWPELKEITGAKLSSIPAAELEEAFVHAFRGVVPNDKQFLGGETIGALFDRVVPALERLVADDAWDIALVVAHGAVNRAILSYVLTGERTFLGRFEQAPGCLNVLDVGGAEAPEWIVRAVNVAPVDLVHRSTRQTTMEQYWAQYRALPASPEEPGTG